MGTSAQKQLAGFMARYDPQLSALAKAALVKLRELIPGAVEIVYDNYNALVIGFGPTERASEAILSIALYPRWVNLFFLQGARLSDPQGLLKGAGKRVRRVVLKDAAVLDVPAVRGLITQALEAAPTPCEPKRPRPSRRCGWRHKFPL